MDNLIAFLRQQLDHDERVARAADGTDLAPWLTLFEAALAAEDQPEDVRRAIGLHVAHFTPGRMLWGIAAKRRILEEHAPTPGWRPFSDPGGRGTALVCRKCVTWVESRIPEKEIHPCRTLRLLAVAYAGREGYRPEWAPS